MTYGMSFLPTAPFHKMRVAMNALGNVSDLSFILNHANRDDHGAKTVALYATTFLQVIQNSHHVHPHNFCCCAGSIERSKCRVCF